MLEALCSNLPALLPPIPKSMIAPESWEESPATEALRSAPDGGLSPLRALAALPNPEPPPERGRTPSFGLGSAPSGMGAGLPFLLEAWRWPAWLPGAWGRAEAASLEAAPFLLGMCLHPGAFQNQEDSGTEDTRSRLLAWG